MAGAAIAQDIKINVTGSNIKRTEAETAAPVEVITREDIQASGLQTIAAVVQSITANNNGTISNSFINGFAAGATGVSLRGLGANNTLVLMNGRRLAVYGLVDGPYESGKSATNGFTSVVDPVRCPVTNNPADCGSGSVGVIARNREIFGSIINVFNRIAPLDVQAAYGQYNYNFNYALAGATGTQFNLGVRYTFK